jgi:hypothetical protein
MNSKVLQFLKMIIFTTLSKYKLKLRKVTALLITEAVYESWDTNDSETIS